MNEESTNSHSGRRNFLKIGIGAGAGLLAGLNSRELLYRYPVYAILLDV